MNEPTWAQNLTPIVPSLSDPSKSQNHPKAGRETASATLTESTSGTEIPEATQILFAFFPPAVRWWLVLPQLWVAGFPPCLQLARRTCQLALLPPRRELRDSIYPCKGGPEIDSDSTAGLYSRPLERITELLHLSEKNVALPIPFHIAP